MARYFGHALGAGARACLMLFALGWGVLAPATAQDLLDRQQALQALVQAEPEQRLAGMLRLADIGTAADADAVLPLLRDTDPNLRQLALPLVWRLWSRSGDAEIDALYQQGVALMQSGALPAAVVVFTHIIDKQPGFAEAWNKRATLLYMLDQYDRSMKDCDEVLRRVPRHFGALSGYAQMLAQSGQPERALTYLERAIAVNPNMVDAQEMVRELRRQIEIRRRNST